MKSGAAREFHVVLTCQGATHQQLALTPRESAFYLCDESRRYVSPTHVLPVLHLNIIRRRDRMSTSLGAICPSCGKQFPTDSLVLRHMNNPQTSCQNWLQFSQSMAQEDLNPPATARSTANADRNGTISDDDDNTSDHTSDHNTSVDMHYEDAHPNAPSFFGSGPTFMHRFDTDPLADRRQTNLYFPFSSKEEWGLASWLLCSGLSMRAIDEFLALPIVSF